MMFSLETKPGFSNLIVYEREPFETVGSQERIEIVQPETFCNPLI